MRFITDKDIESLNISPLTCIQWVKEAFLIKNECTLPPKYSMHPQGTDFINTMPCLLPEKYHTFGCKVVSRIKGSVPALKSNMMVVDSHTGNLMAFMECDWITAWRTAAVAALAIDTYQNSKALIYSFVGLGVIGQATLRCLLDSQQKPGMVIRLKRYKNHAENTVATLAPMYPEVKFEIIDTMDELVKDADVIVSCITDADGLLVEDVNLFKPGVLVVPVHTRGFQNCDTIFEKVFADDEGHVKGFKYFNEFRKFGEISDVLKGNIPGRENDEERILSYNIGLGLHDVFYACKILKEI